MNVRPCWFRVWEHVSGVGLKLTPWRNGAWHAWSQAHEEYESGPGNFPVGVIEDPTGRIYAVPVEDIAFGADKPGD